MMNDDFNPNPVPVASRPLMAVLALAAVFLGALWCGGPWLVEWLARTMEAAR